MFDVFVFCFYSVALVCSLLLKIFWRVGFHCRFVHVCMFDAFMFCLYLVALVCSLLLKIFWCVVCQCSFFMFLCGSHLCVVGTWSL